MVDVLTGSLHIKADVWAHINNEEKKILCVLQQALPVNTDI